MIKSAAKLTVRARLSDPPATVPAGGWEYVNEKTIRLLPAGTPFKQSHVYEFTYTAKDPVVAAVGLAATRDFVSFLRHATKDNVGTANPLAGDVRYVFTFSISQPTRALNDFVALGFNEDEKRGRAVDGMLKWTGGGNGNQINYRFAQTGRTERNRQNHLYPEGVFPFAYPVLTDHLSGKKGGRSARCAASNTCPKAFDGNSSNEYWVKAGSLLHTDTQGNDLPDPENVRFFLISGLSHGVGNVNSMGTCQQYLNPTSPFPALRALLVALDRWVTDGTEPPASRVPRRADNTMVKAVHRPGSQTAVVPQEALGWPTIPGVTYTGLITARYHLDFGPMLDKGIVSKYPPSLDRPFGVPDFRVARRPGRQRSCRYSASSGRGADRHDNGLGTASRGIRRERRVRGQRPAHLVQDHESGTDGCRRSAPFARRTLQESRGLRRGGEASSREAAAAAAASPS